MIRCIAIDDEPLALAQIVKFIERIPTLELVAKCLSVSHAKDVMDEQMIDLLFLDIEMPGMDGFETIRKITAARTIKRRQKPRNRADLRKI